MLILKLLKYSILTVLGVIHVSNDVYFNGKKLKKFIRCANILPTNTLWKEIAKCRLERETNTWLNHVNLTLKVPTNSTVDLSVMVRNGAYMYASETIKLIPNKNWQLSKSTQSIY